MVRMPQMTQRKPCKKLMVKSYKIRNNKLKVRVRKKKNMMRRKMAKNQIRRLLKVKK